MKDCCLDCNAPYGKDGWCDVIIPDGIWNAICPEGGVLCFRCMTKRIEGFFTPLKNIPVIVASGPYADKNEEWRLIGWEHGNKVGHQEALAKSTESEAIWESRAQLATDAYIALETERDLALAKIGELEQQRDEWEELFSEAGVSISHDAEAEVWVGKIGKVISQGEDRNMAGIAAISAVLMHRQFELRQAEQQNAALQQNKRYLDDIAQALHPHKPKDSGWTYIPESLAQMVRDLQAERDQARAAATEGEDKGA